MELVRRLLDVSSGIAPKPNLDTPTPVASAHYDWEKVSISGRDNYSLWRSNCVEALDNIHAHFHVNAFFLISNIPIKDFDIKSFIPNLFPH